MDAPTRRPARLALIAIGGLVLLLATAGTVVAKDGAWVTLTQPIARDATPGTTITVEFAASVPTEDGAGPLFGSPVFVRLTAPDGTTTEGFGIEVRNEPGLYRAEVVVPAGGIESAAFGLRGTAYVNGKASRADELFEIHGWLFTTTGVQAGSAAVAAGGAAPDLRVPIAIAVVIAVAAGGLIAALRRRPLATV
jgi:hypothetical protein